MIIIKKKSNSNKNLAEVIDFFSNDVNFNSIEDIKESTGILQTLCNDISWLIEYAKKYSFCNFEESEILNGKLMTSNSFFIPTYSKKYMMRWNYWQASDTFEDSDINKVKFATDFIHNHDYHLLTACVLGPGYNTNMYKSKNTTEKLFVGDSIDLIELGQYNLNQGSAMFMQANTEFHSQKLPKEASVTINVMIKSSFNKQYILAENNKKFTVSNIINTNKCKKDNISKAARSFLNV